MLVVQHRVQGSVYEYADAFGRLFAEDLALSSVIRRLAFIFVNFIVVFSICSILYIVTEPRIEWAVMSIIAIALAISTTFLFLTFYLCHDAPIPTCVPFFDHASLVLP